MSPDVAASVRARLLNRAKARGEEFEFVLTRFAGERFLFRLGASSAGARCLLKGASLLTAWLRDPYRATRDVDVLSSGAADIATIRELISEVCAVPCPEDGIRFDLSEMRIEPIRAEEEYVGHRARFTARLGTARIRMQVDIGFGDAVGDVVDELHYPTMLPTLPAPRVRAYSRQVSIAEKFEAMVKLDIRNSRMKDFHDVWALSGAFPFDGARMMAAVSACFSRRRTLWSGEMPRPLTGAFYAMPELGERWRRYLAAGGVLVAPPEQFETIGERVIAFLGPIREAIVTGTTLDKRWLPSGTWVAQAEEGGS